MVDSGIADITNPPDCNNRAQQQAATPLPSIATICDMVQLKASSLISENPPIASRK